MKRNKFLVLILVSILASASCKRVEVQETNADEQVSQDFLLYATLWQQTAAEYRACCYQAFNLAQSSLTNKLKYLDAGTKAAVIVDIDETMLDNSPFEAQSILDQKAYSPDFWKAWSDLGKAEPVPGALEFCRYAADSGVEIFYVSNRKINETASTLKNLQQHGFPFADSTHLFLRSNESSKKARRDSIAQTHSIILLIGDNLGDFSEVFENRNSDYGFARVDEYKKEFGSTFIILPNPMYGSWTKPLKRRNQADSLSTDVQLMKKHLKPFEESKKD